MRRHGVGAETGHRMISLGAIAVCLAMVAAPASAGADGGASRLGPEVPEAEGPKRAAAASQDTVADEAPGSTVTSSLQRPGALSAAITRALSRSTEGLRVFELAGGGKGVDLEGRFQHVFVVRVRPDGSFETTCVNHLHSAKQLLLPAPAGAEREARDK